jgi:glycerol-3-phosphate O-acyltransferase
VETKKKTAASSAENEPDSPDPLEGLKVGAAKLAIGLLPGESGLKALAGVLPEKYKGTFVGLIDSYKAQMLKANAGDERRAETALTAIFKDMMKAYAGQIIGTPYEFPSHHICIREPFDYYQMANAYIGSLVEFDRSILRHPERWTAIQTALDAGENVVLLGNHQSEGDAAFIPLLTEVSHPGLGERVTYVAGDRVVTDLLCKPFSMGKNLLCVHSKKHMDDDPALKPAKMKQNLNTVKAMQKLLKKGGLCIWIAPAGGRDRRGADGSIVPDKFDPRGGGDDAQARHQEGGREDALLPARDGDVRHHAAPRGEGEGRRRGARRELHRRGAQPGRGDRRGRRERGVGAKPSRGGG